MPPCCPQATRRQAIVGHQRTPEPTSQPHRAHTNEDAHPSGMASRRGASRCIVAGIATGLCAAGARCAHRTSKRSLENCLTVVWSGRAIQAEDLHGWMARTPWTKGRSPVKWDPDYEAYLLDQWQHCTFDDFWKK